MRFGISILTFVTTCSLGIGLVIYFLFSPYTQGGFTKEEATAKLGHQVRCISAVKAKEKEVSYSKCSSKDGCLDTEIGGHGKVVEVWKRTFGGYFVVVEWDEPDHDGPWLSYFGRYEYSKYLAEE